MNRRNFLKGSVAMGLCAGSEQVLMAGEKEATLTTEKAFNTKKESKIKKLKPTKKPHIIFIMSDQHRGDALHCMGNKVIKTPNIDALAEEGTLFVFAHTSAPSSTPARAGLLTGLSPWHHGMLGYGRVAEHYKYEMPCMLRELGYYTFGVGKMHWFPQKTLHGFHGTLVDESGRNETPNFISDYHAWFNLHAPGKDPDCTGIGWNEHRAAAYKLDKSLHPTTWTGETARELISNYEDERPLYLKISFARPHSPYDPPQRYVDLYKDVEISAPYKGDWANKFAKKTTEEEAGKTAAFANFGDEYAKKSKRYYYANVSFIDDQIGQIIQLLKDRGMYDNAIICYTADHGDMLGDHYHWRKTYAYEGSSKIPFIIKWPTSFKERDTSIKQVEKPVELRDFLPTFLELVGGDVPKEIDGQSLLSLVTQKDPVWRKYIDMEHSTCYSKENYWCALTDGKIKYIWFFHTGEEQLFDLTTDAHEEHNLFARETYATKLKEMRAAMVDHLSERGDGFVKNGKLVIRKETMLYGPNYPRKV